MPITAVDSTTAYITTTTISTLKTMTNNVKICKHPLVAHKLSTIRDKNTCSKDFREIVREIGTFLGYEAMADLTLSNVGTVINNLHFI